MGNKKPLFELLDHCCRVCGGRLLLGDAPDGGRLLRCAECGAFASVSASSRTPHAALCFCGYRLATGADAGLRCRRVPQPTPERPNEVVVQQSEPLGGRRTAPGPRPVRISGQDD